MNSKKSIWRLQCAQSWRVLALALLTTALAACGGATEPTATAVTTVGKEAHTALASPPAPQSDIDALTFARKPDVVKSYTPPPESVAPDATQRARNAHTAPRLPTRVVLAGLPTERRNAVLAIPVEPGVPRKVAEGRASASTLDSAAVSQKLIWETRANGVRTAALQMSSPGAAGLRMGVRIDRLPDEATLRFSAAADVIAHAFTAVEMKAVLQRNREAGDTSEAARTFWSPYMDGDTLTVELDLPANADVSRIAIAVPLLSHFFVSPAAADEVNEPRIGEAAYCNADVSCYAESALSNATAKMVYTGDGGASYSCTGTLLNDRASSGTPYFLSANHCISKQSQASTLQTFWFYRSASCNSRVLSSAAVTRSGGATLLYSSSRTDTSFMRLNSTPPAGAMFSGWAASSLSVGTAITGLHHPVGDLQKISLGSLSGYRTCLVINPTTGGFTCQDSSQAASTFFNVLFTTGTTEGGSSGSGLFANVGDGKVLVGQLYGGSSSCSNRSGSNTYGRFDVAYNTALSAWLDAAGNPTTHVLTVAKQGAGNGTVVSVPGGISCGSACSASFSTGSTVILTATPAAGSSFAGWGGACAGTLPSCFVSMSSAQNVVANFTTPPVTLATALDNAQQVWITAGTAPFFGQSAAYTTGGAAARSGKVGNLQSSSLSTMVTGPGQLSFDWKVSSEADYDYLTVSLDGGMQYRISGESAWISSVLDVPSGNHTVKWEYSKDEFVSDGEDAGWVDNVKFAHSGATVSALRNGDFESGTVGWVPSSSFILWPTPTRIPAATPGSTRAAWMCGYNECADTLYQDVTIAAGASSALLSFSYYVESAELSLSRVYDAMSVEVRSVATSARLALLTTISNLSLKNRWLTFSADLKAFAGQTVRLFFSSTTDALITTSFFVDNVSLNLTSATDAMGVEPQNGWWWNATESGRGFAIERQGNKIFMGGFMYETSGAATWYVATLTLQSNGSYAGEFTRYVGGQTLLGPFRAVTSTTKVADVVLHFSEATAGTLRVTPVGGSTSTINLQRFPISAPTSFATSNAAFQSGWWWNANEPGRGYFIEIQGNQAFFVAFTYEVSGQPTWYVGSAGLTNNIFLLGQLQQYVNGQSLQGAFRSPVAIPGPGSLAFAFANDVVGSLVLPGGQQVKLTRFPF